jgi:multidrug efflux pump subunit AcrA (membrane-fusion protein)
VDYDQAMNEVENQRKLMAKDPNLVLEIDIKRVNFALRSATSKLQAARERYSAGAKSVDALKEQLKLYSLTAPITGRIGRVLVARGQALHVGDPVAEVLDIDDEIDVLCWVPAGMVGRLKVGQDAKRGPLYKHPKAPDAEADGKVAYLADQADPDTGNFAVKVRFSNKAAHLRANRLIRVRVLTQPVRECLAIPESAVMEDEDPPSVVIVENIVTKTNDDGKEEKTGTARVLQVEFGVRDRTLHQIEIKRLIDKENKWHGDIKDAQIVVTGLQGLRTDDPVKLEADED